MIPHHEKIGLMSLSKDYSFSLSPALGSSETKPVVLRIESKKEFSALSRTGWEHLDQASRLGLLRWPFRGVMPSATRSSKLSRDASKP